MKIATFGLDIQPGKHKYSCACFDKLVKKFSPKKETPFTVEFLGEDFTLADAIVFDKNRIFDFVFIDIEKIEKRLSRSPSAEEAAILTRCQALVEKEQLLCEEQFDEKERQLLKNLGLVTYIPSLGIDDTGDINEVIDRTLQKAGVILFFTAGKKEVRAWSLSRGSSIVAAAGRIHSDLARGFIKADVVNCDKIDEFFNMAEARSRGFVDSVGKEYIVRQGDIIEVKFNV